MTIRYLMTNLPNMRIKQIAVKKLFGLFDHVIPLNMEEHITIIHGPNGFGKTILLKMLNGLFNGRYSIFRSIPFEEFQVTFDDGDYIKIDFPKSKKKSVKNPPKVTLYKPNSQEKPAFSGLLARDFVLTETSLDLIEYAVPSVERIGHDHWQDSITGNFLLLDDVLDRFNLPLDFVNISVANESWREGIKNKTRIQYIETERLLSLSILPNRRNKPPQMIASVIKYAKDLTNLIESKLADYSQLSQSLDRTFPTRLVSQTNKTNPITEEELRKQLTQLEAKRSQFKAVGLLKKEEDSGFQIPQQFDENAKNVLAIYVRDVEQKLGVFDELAQKIELFQQIIKNRFLYKQITMSEEEGFFFSTHDGQRLAVTDLSSGEQHELILLYELLFKTKPNSLILIDEPELSLHIAWQSQFIKDLEAITKLGSFDILVATHSPDIISNRWDLTVELKGPEMSLAV